MENFDDVIQVDTVNVSKELIDNLPKFFELYIKSFIDSEIIMKDKRRNPLKYFVSEVSCVLYDNDFIKDLFTIYKVIKYKTKGVNETVINIDFKSK